MVAYEGSSLSQGIENHYFNKAHCKFILSVSLFVLSYSVLSWDTKSQEEHRYYRPASSEAFRFIRQIGAAELSDDLTPDNQS